MELRYLLSVFLLLILHCPQGDCISIQEFFPFGSAAEDEVLSLGDDSSSEFISLSPSYPILQAQWSSLKVTANGVISLNASFIDYMAKKFPCTSCPLGNIIICPFWADLDTRYAGTISHNNGTLNTTIATRVTQLIQEIFRYNFSPSGIFISTWDRLPHHNVQLNPELLSVTNTFQCVLATNGADTFAFFLYADDLIQWTLDGVQIGIDGGDGVNHYTVPGSLTPDIINITDTSNVNRPGLWIFKLDSSIIGGPPDSPIDPIITSISTTEATFEWRYNDTTNKPENFTMTCLSEPSARNTTFIIEGESTNFTNITYFATGLEEYTNYTCSILGTNIFGEGPASDVFSIMTNPAAPTEPPLNVRTTVVYPTSLVLEWSPPSEEERNGPLTGYSVVLEWEEGQEHRVDTADTNYTFTELQQGTTYHCSIAARTSVGTGPYYTITISIPPATTLAIDTAIISPETPKTSAHVPEDMTKSNENTNFGLIGGVSGAATFIVVMAIVILMVILCTKRFHAKNTATSTEVEMDDHCNVYEKVTANTTVLNAYLEEPDEQEKDDHCISRRGTVDQEKKQKHGPALQNSSETAHRKKHPMLPPTVTKSVPTLPTTTNSDGIYMSLSSNRRQEEQQSQYMSLSAATRKTQSNVGASAWRRAQESKDTQSRWRAQREVPEEPVYMNQAKRSKCKDHVIEEPFP